MLRTLGKTKLAFQLGKRGWAAVGLSPWEAPGPLSTSRCHLAASFTGWCLHLFRHLQNGIVESVST